MTCCMMVVISDIPKMNLEKTLRKYDLYSNPKMNRYWPEAANIASRIVVNLVPILSRIKGKANGQIIELTALAENSKLN